MDVIRTIKAGEPGSRRFLPQYGTDLVCVRYRKPASEDIVYTTIEIIVDRRDYEKNINHQAMNKQKLWVLPYGLAVELGISNRVVEGAARECTDVDLYS